MRQKYLTPMTVLSAIIAILATVASAGGLFLDNLYLDNTLVAAAYRGNDLITLVIAVPLLAAAMLLAQRGSPRAQLVWMGGLGYMLYNYIFYLYGAAMNRFFLLYVALFTLSIYALILGLAQLDANGIARRFRARTPTKWIAGWMLFFALLLGGLWVARSVSFVVTGETPQDVLQTGHPTAVVYATDLSLLVSSLVVAAVWLWQRRPWGYGLATILMVKCVTYPLALLAMSVFSFLAGTGWDSLTPLWAFLGAGCVAALGLLLGNMQPAEEQTVPAPQTPGALRPLP
ncbi:MAG TPA: hypothetical protein VNK95_00780 [Caldilineaceae bacterium]|nr:hypothetical protein [Caldilineaceae bacterium]